MKNDGFRGGFTYIDTDNVRNVTKKDIYFCDFFETHPIKWDLLPPQKRKELKRLILKRRVKAFLKKHRDSVKLILTVLKTVIAGAYLLGFYLVLHTLATQQRGYEAVGGEILVFLLPIIIVCVRDGIHDLFDIFKSHK